MHGHYVLELLLIIICKQQHANELSVTVYCVMFTSRDLTLIRIIKHTAKILKIHFDLIVSQDDQFYTDVDHLQS